MKTFIRIEGSGPLVDADGIRELIKCESNVTVEDIYIAGDQTNAIAETNSQEKAEKILERLNGYLLNGYPIKVEILSKSCASKSSHSSKSKDETVHYTASSRSNRNMERKIYDEFDIVSSYHSSSERYSENDGFDITSFGEAYTSNKYSGLAARKSFADFDIPKTNQCLRKVHDIHNHRDRKRYRSDSESEYECEKILKRERESLGILYSDISGLDRLRVNEIPRNHEIISYQVTPPMYPNPSQEHSIQQFPMQTNLQPNINNQFRGYHDQTQILPTLNPPHFVLQQSFPQTVLIPPSFQHSVPFVGQSVPFVGKSAPFVGQNVPFVGHNVPFVEQSVSFVEQYVPFVEQNVPFVEQNVPFVDQNVSFVDQSVRFVAQNGAGVKGPVASLPKQTTKRNKDRTYRWRIEFESKYYQFNHNGRHYTLARKYVSKRREACSKIAKEMSVIPLVFNFVYEKKKKACLQAAIGARIERLIHGSKRPDRADRIVRYYRVFHPASDDLEFARKVIETFKRSENIDTFQPTEDDRAYCEGNDTNNEIECLKHNLQEYVVVNMRHIVNIGKTIKLWDVYGYCLEVGVRERIDDLFKDVESVNEIPQTTIELYNLYLRRYPRSTDEAFFNERVKIVHKHSPNPNIMQISADVNSTPTNTQSDAEDDDCKLADDDDDDADYVHAESAQKVVIGGPFDLAERNKYLFVSGFPYHTSVDQVKAFLIKIYNQDIQHDPSKHVQLNFSVIKIQKNTTCFKIRIPESMFDEFLTSQHWPRFVKLKEFRRKQAR